MRIGSTSRSELGKRTNPYAAQKPTTPRPACRSRPSRTRPCVGAVEKPAAVHPAGAPRQPGPSQHTLWNSFKGLTILVMLSGAPVKHILPRILIPMHERHGATAICGWILVSERPGSGRAQTVGRASSLIVSKSRTEIEAEPHTRSSAALAAALFSASANDSGDAASGEFGTSRMT